MRFIYMLNKCDYKNISIILQLNLESKKSAEGHTVHESLSNPKLFHNNKHMYRNTHYLWKSVSKIFRYKRVVCL